MKPEVISIFSKLIEMYMKDDVYDYDVLSMTVTSKPKFMQNNFSMDVRLTEYGPSGKPDEYNLTFKVSLDRDYKDVNFVILNDDGGNCIEINQDAMAYTEEMIKEENAKYKDFLLKAFEDFF